jgi:hypothetical protein
MLKRIKRIVFALSTAIFILLMSEAQAQCCAMGNPFNNSSVAGSIETKGLHLSIAYKYGYYETYFRDRVRLINYGMYREISYQYAALNLSYGINERLGVEHETGYFISKAPRFADPELDKFANAGSGLSNGILLARYVFMIIPSKQIQFDLGAGFKYPYSTTSQFVNGIELPVEAQPSTGAYGAVFQLQGTKRFGNHVFALQHRYDFNTKNYNNYIFGDANITTLSFATQLNRYINGVILLRNELRGSDKAANNARLASEGSNLLILAPQIGFIPVKNFQISVFGDLPVYRRYYGEQISSRYAMGISLIFRTSFQKSIPASAGFENIMN